MEQIKYVSDIIPKKKNKNKIEKIPYIRISTSLFHKTMI